MNAAPAISNQSTARVLASNTLWNLLGQLLPMGVAAIAIPLLIHGLGISQFGILSLTWILIGYFSLFDLGIGRALTKLVAEKAGIAEPLAIVPLVWTSLVLMLLLGVIGGLILLAFSPWLVHKILKIPAALQAESLHGCYLVAACIPFTTIGSGLRGLLEGLHHFRLLNLIRIPLTVFSFAGPLLVLPFSRSLVWVIAVLVLVRIVGCFIHFVVCFAALPPLRDNLIFDRSLIKPLVIFGGWMTVSNVISPLLVYVDRFILGAMVSTSLVAYYTAPFDVVTRLTVIPGAVAGVLFPAFALSLAQDPDRAQQLLNRSLRYIFLAVFPIASVVVTFAPECLRLWLGTAFAQNSSSVLRWLMAGVFANSLAHVPFAFVQSAGRPDVTAKLHIFELPVYIVSVWLLTRSMGIQGTAIAWTGRLVLDALLIAYALRRVVWRESRYLLTLGTLLTLGLTTLFCGTLMGSVSAKLVFIALNLLGFALMVRSADLVGTLSAEYWKPKSR